MKRERLRLVMDPFTYILSGLLYVAFTAIGLAVVIVLGSALASWLAGAIVACCSAAARESRSKAGGDDDRNGCCWRLIVDQLIPEDVDDDDDESESGRHHRYKCRRLVSFAYVPEVDRSDDVTVGSEAATASVEAAASDRDASSANEGIEVQLC